MLDYKIHNTLVLNSFINKLMLICGRFETSLSTMQKMVIIASTYIILNGLPKPCARGLNTFSTSGVQLAAKSWLAGGQRGSWGDASVHSHTVSIAAMSVIAHALSQSRTLNCRFDFFTSPDCPGWSLTSELQTCLKKKMDVLSIRSISQIFLGI